MKKTLFALLLLLFSVRGFSQESPNNTLLWRISGNNLSQPSYLFGTIHLLCADDIEISDSLRSAIQKSRHVYLEVDLNNIFEMMSAMQKMKMRNDTTLADLLTPEEYNKVKAFFQSKSSPLPFSILETYKPMLTTSVIMESSFDCEKAVAMEQLIMQEARNDHKGIKGLETVAYQLGIIDSIPYRLQAKELLSFVEGFDSSDKSSREYDEMITAYRNQELDKLDTLMKADEAGLEAFSDLLLYNRNSNWVKKLGQLLPQGPFVFAVGAGHLPGPKGLIRLLRQAGFTVEPVENKMIRSKFKEI